MKALANDDFTSGGFSDELKSSLQTVWNDEVVQKELLMSTREFAFNESAP